MLKQFAKLSTSMRLINQLWSVFKLISIVKMYFTNSCSVIWIDVVQDLSQFLCEKDDSFSFEKSVLLWKRGHFELKSQLLPRKMRLFSKWRTKMGSTFSFDWGSRDQNHTNESAKCYQYPTAHKYVTTWPHSVPRTRDTINCSHNGLNYHSMVPTSS